MYFNFILRLLLTLRPADANHKQWKSIVTEETLAEAGLSYEYKGI